ncbi:MAG: GNAT family N-acetyltransferase [Anaerolineales bacterium]
MDTATLIRIRPARENDLPALEWDGEYRHYRRVYQQTFDDVRKGRRLMLLAVAENAIIGQVFVQLQGGTDWGARGGTTAEEPLGSTLPRSPTARSRGGKRGYVYAFRVKPDWRRRGVGRQLMAAAETELLRRGFHLAVIAVAQNNPDARRLYERLGYVVFSEDAGIWHYTDADGVQRRVEEPSWLMDKRLG